MDGPQDTESRPSTKRDPDASRGQNFTTDNPPSEPLDAENQELHESQHGKQPERHGDRHLEELALFALPQPEDDRMFEETAVPSDEELDNSNWQTQWEECSQCGRVMRDLNAHMLTHSTHRPYKCPVVTCEYHTRGLPRLYDQIRHTLAHFRGEMICGFCPDSEEHGPHGFKRADVFKRHLTSVHGVEQTPPNSRKTRPSTATGVSHTGNLAGDCSVCKETFSDPQHLYEHLDSCVIQAVEQQNPSMTEDQTRTAGTKHGEDAQEMRRFSKM